MDTSFNELRARRTELIKTLAIRGRDAELRQFAVWCARQTDLSEPAWVQLVNAAEGHTLGELSLAEMLDIRNAHAGTAMPACVIGLNHGASNAAAFMSAWQTTRQDAKEAARESAKMAAIWATMVQGGQGLVENEDTVRIQVAALRQASRP